MNDLPDIPHSKPSLGACEVEQLADVVSSGFVAPGEKSRQLGALVAERYGCRFGLALNSCTSALHLALLSMGVGPGDRVAVPGLVCPSVAHPITYVGAEAVVIDVRVRDHQMDLARLKNTHAKVPVKAVIIPYRYGHVVDLAEIRDAGIKIIEDNAHAFGATFLPPAPMLQGSAGVFSFYATKMIATGCGGALVTNDDEIAAFADVVSDYYSPGTSHQSVRYNYRMSDVNAALGLSQMKQLDQFILRRRALAARYMDLLANEFRVVAPEQTSGSVWYRFVVGTKGKDHQRAILDRSSRNRCGIGRIDILFDPANAPHEELRISRAEWENCVSLPIYPGLSEEAQDRIVSCVRHAS